MGSAPSPTPHGDDQPQGRETFEHQIVIPDDVPMVTLLGRRDEVLRAIEHGFPRVDIHVRGNLFTFAGPAGEVALAERLVDELTEVARGGQPLTADERSEEHTSELQSRGHLVCRLLLEKKKKKRSST